MTTCFLPSRPGFTPSRPGQPVPQDRWPVLPGKKLEAYVLGEADVRRVHKAATLAVHVAFEEAGFEPDVIAQQMAPPQLGAPDRGASFFQLFDVATAHGPFGKVAHRLDAKLTVDAAHPDGWFTLTSVLTMRCGTTFVARNDEPLAAFCPVSARTGAKEYSRALMGELLHEAGFFQSTVLPAGRLDAFLGQLKP